MPTLANRNISTDLLMMLPMKLLLFALLPLTEAYISPNNNNQIPRSSDPSPSLFFLHNSNSACSGHCPDGWAYLSETNACYKNFLWATFDDAESLCAAFGGHVASIHSYRENSFVAEMARSGIKTADDYMAKHTMYIGLHGDKENQIIREEENAVCRCIPITLWIPRENELI
ncbi:unnamed protein product [Cylicocyclus nassatus]|uniref:C-type lectin domain-containing protein n=1 Tax=Cylicocyclus nassatus TaxID=53992 RepID=A0AA36GZV0_CYLNA|nr:unnamed protein product [Cylicocyclus nassatus]